MKTNKSKKYEKGSQKVGDFNTLMSFILYMSDIMNHEHRMKNIIAITHTPDWKC